MLIVETIGRIRREHFVKGKAEAVQAASEAELAKLHAKIGQLVIEKDFSSKAFGR
jgi:hypothetical protein